MKKSLTQPEKRRAGGLRTCPDCAEETTIPYLAVKAVGKMSDLTILQFESSPDRVVQEGG